MNASCSLLPRVKHYSSLLNPMETPHDSGLDQAHRPIHVVILNSRDQNFLSLLHQVVLDSAYMLNTADVLVEFRVNRHVLGSNSEALAMLVLILDVEHERYAGWVPSQHLLEE